MSGLYPAVEVAVVAACLGMVLFALATLARDRGLWPSLAWTGLGLGWFLVLWELARAGAFEGTRGSGRAVEIAAMVVSLAVGWALLQAAQRTAPLAADLVTIQTTRLVAVVVLLALAGEALPAWLALPIGLGDVLVGLSAIGVARGLGGTARRGARAARTWNAAGMALAVFSIAAPIASARSSGYFFSLYPLVLFPTFLAPVWLVLHVAIQRGVAGAGSAAPRG